MFPSILNTFNRPAVTDRLNSPSHSALHNTVSSAVGQIQAVIGLNTGANASAVGTIFNDVRSPDSNGGGHVQTANKGGTGQTTYTKGDLLVATSTSVLSKLAVSSTLNDILIADPSQSAGLKWGTNPNSNRVVVNPASVVYAGGKTSILQVIFSASIVGSTLGTNNALMFEGDLQKFTVGAGINNVLLSMTYGSNAINITTPVSLSGSVMSGVIRGGIANYAGTSSQVGWIQADVRNQNMGVLGPNGVSYFAKATGTSSIESTADQTFTVKLGVDAVATATSILTGLFVMEKIT